jgi:HlyD family secretion protein
MSQLRAAQAQLQKTLNGARPEERRQAQANLDSTKKNLEVAQAELARIEKLVAEGALAGNRLDQQQNAVAAALAQFRNAQEAVAIQTAGSRKEDIDSAREQVRQAQEAVKNAQTAKQLDVTLTDQVDSAKANLQSAMAQIGIIQQNISDMTVRAPISGRIMGKPAQPGQIVGSGAVVARIVGLGATYFEGNIPEYQLSKVTVGKAVTIQIDALGTQTYSGHVAAISPVGGSVGRLFSARIEIDGKPAEVRPGMFARGIIVINTVPGAVLVPTRAVVTMDGTTSVFTVDGTKAKRVPVKVGLTKGDRVQVTGLAPGSKLVVKGQEGLSDGSVIKVEEPEAQAAPAAKG